MAVPVIDLSPMFRNDRDSDEAVGNSVAAEVHRLGAEVNDVCRRIGFFAIVGHGIDPAMTEAAHQAAQDFFQLPLNDRMTAARPDPTYPYGYVPFSAEALNQSIGGQGGPDLKETYNVGPVGEPPRPRDQMTDLDERAAWAPTIWPEAMPTLRPALEQYYLAMSDLAVALMDVFAVALGLPVDWFRPLINQHSSALRLAHYPSLDRPPGSNRMRAGAHTDYGTLTILRLDEEPGLQVQLADGEWQDVTAPDGAFVVNLGDLTQRWTNNRWRSTMHRVVVPDGGHTRSRLTMPFFHNANWDARVECLVGEGEEPLYEPVLAGAHLMEKFRSTAAEPADNPEPS